VKINGYIGDWNDYLCVMQINEPQIQQLADSLKAKFPEIRFAYLFGSASSYVIAHNSDIDIAVYLKHEKPSTVLIAGIIGAVEEQFPGYRCDLTVLNNAGILISMEVLKGKILFIKDEARNVHADFYSYTCRMFEDETAWIKKQLLYRGYEVQWNN
jgi:predicted nucleotidyltransferase